MKINQKETKKNHSYRDINRIRGHQHHQPRSAG